MDVGLVGLGNMGSAMAHSLLRAGHRVTAFNRSPGPATALASEGATIAATPAAAAAVGVVLSMLADDHAVETVTLGPNGILAGLPADGIHVSMSTISVALSERLTRAHADAGQGYLAAPVFGRPDAALAAKLFVVAAGDPAAIERVRPLLEAVGQRLFVLGPVANQANVVKLAGNFLIAAVIEGLAESTAFVTKAGVDPAAFVEVLTNSLFTAPVYKTYGQLIIERKFSPPGFAVPLGLKDIRLALHAAEDVAAPLPFASVVRDHFLQAIAAGWGALDWSALALVAERAAGVARKP